jgi:hypothetical protein
VGVFEKNILQNQNLEYFWKKSSNQFNEKDSFFKEASRRFNSKSSSQSELAGISSFVNRLSNPTYLNNTNSKAIQPVIKIISKLARLSS